MIDQFFSSSHSIYPFNVVSVIIIYFQSFSKRFLGKLYNHWFLGYNINMSTKKARIRSEDDPGLKNHLQRLGLGSVQEYKDWCRRHGFSRNINKTGKQFRDETLIIARQAADAMLAKRKFRDPATASQSYFAGEIEWKDLPINLRGIDNWQNRQERWAPDFRETVVKLAIKMQSCVGESLVFHSGKKPILTGLIALAQLKKDWIRPLEDWEPTSHNSRRQFSSLARHLLAKYFVPRFMDVCFFEDHILHQLWYIHIGLGYNIRKAIELPIPMTKMMAHHFMKAPDDYSFNAAIRWGQIYSLGGDARLANAIRGTMLENAFVHDDFWETVIRWFIVNPMLDTAHVGPIIDYLQNQRYAGRRIFVGPGVVEERGPEQPNMSMKNRDPDALLKAVAAWHKKLGKERRGENSVWTSCGLPGFELQEGEAHNKNCKIWTIREMLSHKELVADGRALHHCGGSYAHSCSSGRCSMWTMELEDYAGTHKVLTIEVNKSNVISQARGNYNAKAEAKPANIMARWAQQAGLSVASYI